MIQTMGEVKYNVYKCSVTMLSGGRLQGLHLADDDKVNWL